MWMICQTNIPEIQPDSLMNKFGFFDLKKGTLMLYSRRGLNFSTTRFIKKLNPEHVLYIDDIEKENFSDPGSKYCFTDGCGNISPGLCKIIEGKYMIGHCSAI